MEPNVVRDEIHIITKNVPRISTSGELSRAGYQRRRTRANLISTLLGFGLVIVFAVGLFAFVWKYWLEEIFSDAERMNVPSFVGQTEETIMNDPSMTELFAFHVTYKADSVHPVGEIIGQSPDAGASRMIVKDGIDVELTVSSGIKLVEMPNVVNIGYTDAQVQLHALDLNVEVSMEASDSVTKNYVLSTYPEAGASVSSGSTVTLYVSAGPNVTYAIVPNVVGMTSAEAFMTLQQQGFICSESDITYVSSDAANEGKVLWQSLPAGDSRIFGSPISLQIGTASAAAANPQG